MSLHRCVYCGDEHAAQPLPYECPACGRLLRVTGAVGGSLPEVARQELMLVEDRRLLDDIDSAIASADLPERTYEIVEGGRAIKCLLCGLTSYHPKDVEHRFCGKCDLFHEDLRLQRMIERKRTEEGVTD